MREPTRVSDHVMRQCVIGGAGQPSSSSLYNLDWFDIFDAIVGNANLPFGSDIEVLNTSYPVRPSLLNGKRCSFVTDMNEVPPGLYLVKDSVLSGKDSVFLLSVHDDVDISSALSTQTRWSSFQASRGKTSMILARVKQTLIVCAPWRYFFQ